MEIYYIDRKTKEKVKEAVAGEKLLRWTFESKPGQVLLEKVIKKNLSSRAYGAFQDASFSSKKIADFVSDFDIDMSEAVRENPKEYKSFNDFFTRKLKPSARPVDFNPENLISPCDGKILCYENIDIKSLYQIKDSSFSLLSLLNDEALASEYESGTFIVIRLAPSDYHRFHFLDNCSVLSYLNVKGSLYSVNPMCLRQIPKVYCENKRDITVLDTENFGKVVSVEVGATFVGTIVQTFDRNSRCSRGDEKGYFKFGGSTVIHLLKKDTVKIDQDLIANTRSGFETSIKFGEKIGEKRSKKDRTS